MRLVLIEWIDSYGCSSTWENLEGCKPSIMSCKSVGWLVHDGDDCKTVVPHVANGAQQGCGDMTIPTCAITRLVDLGVPEDHDEKYANTNWSD